MNEKSYIALETVKNDRTYTLLIPVGAPLGEAYDACYECLMNMVERANKAAEQAKAPEKEKVTEEAAS